jgi:ribosomal-protein-alanine N-acetyltransferase
MGHMEQSLAVELGLARIAEAPMLARVSRDYIERGLPWRWKPSRLRSLIKDPETVVLCARSKPLRVEDLGAPETRRLGNLLGFGVMTYERDRAHLMLLATLPRARRRGIASHLLRWLEKTASTAGIERIKLEVRARNSGARTFYREHGYQERDYIPRYYGGEESAFRMTRTLFDRNIAADQE